MPEEYFTQNFYAENDHEQLKRIYFIFITLLIQEQLVESNILKNF